MDTDLSWTQIYVGHRSMLDTDLSWTTDPRWSTGPSWVTFSDNFRTFSRWSLEGSREIFINRKALLRGSRGVLPNFFSELFRKVPRSFSSTPGCFSSIFGKIGFGALGPLGPPWGPPYPNEDSYTNSRSTARQAAAMLRFRYGQNQDLNEFQRAGIW